MSGTRSHSPRVPAIEALIVAHGQPSDPVPADAQTGLLAERVAALLPGARVRGATLALPGSLDRALACYNAPPTIYPLFMSNGWFTATALPDQLKGAAGRILAPLGLDLRLAHLAAQDITRAAAARNWPLRPVRLIFAAHGSSRSRNPARAAQDFAQELTALLPIRDIRIGFIDERPSLAEAARDAGQSSICLPFFAAAGGHPQNDIPRELATAGFTGLTLEPIGLHPGIPALIARALSRATAPWDEVSGRHRKSAPDKETEMGMRRSDIQENPDESP